MSWRGFLFRLPFRLDQLGQYSEIGRGLDRLATIGPEVRAVIEVLEGNYTSPSLIPAVPWFRRHSATLEDGGVNAVDWQVRMLMEEMAKHGRTRDRLVLCPALLGGSSRTEEE